MDESSATSPQQLERCTKCDCSSVLIAAFSKSGHGKKAKVLCPGCVTEERDRRSAAGLIRISVIFLLALYCALTTKRPNTGWGVVNLCLTAVMMWLSIFPHELAHAGVSALLGLPTRKIVFGSGKIQKRLLLWGMVLEIRTYPTIGLTYSEFRDEPFARRKQALVLIAGP